MLPHLFSDVCFTKSNWRKIRRKHAEMCTHRRLSCLARRVAKAHLTWKPVPKSSIEENNPASSGHSAIFTQTTIVPPFVHVSGFTRQTDGESTSKSIHCFRLRSVFPALPISKGKTTELSAKGHRELWWLQRTLPWKTILTIPLTNPVPVLSKEFAFSKSKWMVRWLSGRGRLRCLLDRPPLLDAGESRMQQSPRSDKDLGSESRAARRLEEEQQRQILIFSET